jgi:hypothetical protein
MGTSHENYYPTVAINALMRILNDTSLSVHHQMGVTTFCYNNGVLPLPSLFGGLQRCICIFIWAQYTRFSTGKFL